MYDLEANYIILLSDLTGFDEKVSSLEGLYGAGCYFASNSNKSDQYTDRVAGEKIILYCRVTLGHAFFTDRVMRNERHAPPLPPPNEHAFHNSVVADPGPKEGHPRNPQIHRELVIFSGRLVYPQYIVRYRKL